MTKFRLDGLEGLFAYIKRILDKIFLKMYEIFPVYGILVLSLTRKISIMPKEIKNADGEYHMKNTGINSKVISEIRHFAEIYHVEKVLLFGSRARGDYKRTSDIDLAVSGGDFNRFALDVDEETSTLLEFDIVNLDSPMQDELRESIEKEGRILYEKI